MALIYLIGSLRNKEIPELGKWFRSQGFEVFDDWFAAGPEADDYWRTYEKNKGLSYEEALRGWAAKNVFAFDHKHLDRSDIVVLALPAGKSGHLELGYAIGRGKPGYILLDQDYDRWDVMYQFAKGVYFDKEKLVDELRKLG
jgi:hypothetical protein